VLDVGAGRGSFAIWAALSGAAFVLGLEPQAAGSTGGALDVFQRLVSELQLEDKVIASAAMLEQLESSQRFDVVTMYNVINHLDEEAVIHLHESEAARSAYVKLLVNLRGHLSAEARVIVADSSPENVWGRLGVTTPLTRPMEWRKHQRPEAWTALFAEAGFRLQDLRWSPLFPFMAIQSRTLQLFVASPFVLRFRTEPEG
jgi:2-polyprenyl-3-methyl-5-hydroxy-6-metoxy-1,4-benzoquinol methylase